MLRRRLYTFIVASHANGKLFRLSIPYSVLIAIGTFALIGLVSAGMASYHYGRMALQVADYERLLGENDSFRAENHNYRIQTAQLGEKIDYLETVSRKLMILSGMNSDRGVGGVGGYSEDSFSQPLPAGGTLESIDGIRKNVASLEERFRGLDLVLTERALVEASRPAFLPLRGYVTEGMGRRRDPFNGSIREYHTGLDISGPYGARIIAPADGLVIFAGQREGYGNIVVLDHKFGVTTRYGHLSKFTVRVGQRVSRHDVIGYVGTTGRTTGPHLHFEMWVHNRPVNPLKYIPDTQSAY